MPQPKNPKMLLMLLQKLLKNKKKLLQKLKRKLPKQKLLKNN
jgi:hypothetical protein